MADHELGEQLFEDEADPVAAVTKRLSFSACDVACPAGENGAADPEVSVARTIKTYLRIRPIGEDADTITVVDEKTVRTKPPVGSQSHKNRVLGRVYQFSNIFEKTSSQQELFETTTMPLLDDALNGNDALLFTYGVTNAGKTYTVQGDEENPGLIPRALEYLLGRIDGSSMTAAVSYMQVYNENVYDLQVEEGCTQKQALMASLRVKLRSRGVEIEGLKKTSVGNVQEGLEILRRGTEARATKGTVLNIQSSRSHSVFVVYLRKRSSENGAVEKENRVFIVDLAGSERFHRAQGRAIDRQRQREASNINQSLMNLMRCLDAMRYNQKKRPGAPQKVVPFRQSKLTMLFRDCLIGERCGHVAMIVNANPSNVDYDETVHALKYGAIANQVKIQARVSSRRPSSAYGYDGRLRRPGSMRASTAPVATINEEEEADMNEEENCDRATTSAAYDSLVASLRHELGVARSRCFEIETEVREECALEMSTRLSEMQAMYRIQTEEAKRITEEKFISKLALVRKKLAKAENINEVAESNLYSMADVEELCQQIDECEEEMNRMQAQHSQQMEASGGETKILREENERLKQQLDDRADVSKADIHLECRRTAAAKEELSNERAEHEKTKMELADALKRLSEAMRSAQLSPINIAEVPAGSGHSRSSSKRKSGDVEGALAGLEPSKRPRSSEDDEEEGESAAPKNIPAVSAEHAMGSMVDFRAPEQLPSKTSPPDASHQKLHVSTAEENDANEANTKKGKTNFLRAAFNSFTGKSKKSKKKEQVKSTKFAWPTSPIARRTRSSLRGDKKS